MADMEMTVDERTAFLAEVHVAILAIERLDRAPVALPIWYRYDDGDVVIHMDGGSLKARLLSRAGRATMTVQTETPPYRYVMVEGPVTIAPVQGDDREMASRYLGPELGAWYADKNPISDDSVVVRLRPEHWITCDFSKMAG